MGIESIDEINSINEKIQNIINSIKNGQGNFEVYIDNYASLAYGDNEIDYNVEDKYNPENHFLWDHNVI